MKLVVLDTAEQIASTAADAIEELLTAKPDAPVRRAGAPLRGRPDLL